MTSVFHIVILIPASDNFVTNKNQRGRPKSSKIGSSRHSVPSARDQGLMIRTMRSRNNPEVSGQDDLISDFLDSLFRKATSSGNV